MIDEQKMKKLWQPIRIQYASELDQQKGILAKCKTLTS